VPDPIAEVPPMKITRRELLTGAAAAGIGGSLPRGGPGPA